MNISDMSQKCSVKTIMFEFMLAVCSCYICVVDTLI